MMRVAIAGTGGLAFLLAHYLHEETGHPFILLSRSEKPQLAQQGFQVVVVDYDDAASLRYALTGVNVVISTVPGTVQVHLIDAAVAVGVSRFIPAEFEGPFSSRPVDALDRGKATVLQHLQQNSQHIEWTTFVCGVLYERFAPYGLYGSDMGKDSGISKEGDYLLNLRTMTGELPLYDPTGQPVTICLTAAQDVARFVVRSLDLQKWTSKEMTMVGEKITTQQLVSIAENVRGQYFYNITFHDTNTLNQELSAAQAASDYRRISRALQMIATQSGRYNYSHASLNAAFPQVTPLRFREWLFQRWTGQ